MSVATKTKIALITNVDGVASVTGKLSTALPTDTSADPTVTRALDTATRINSAGNIATVVANKGRITYRLGTNKCPNLLVERTRINLFATPLVPATQNVTVVNATVYTVSVVGSGIITLSGAGSGVVTEANPITFTSAGTTLTCTVAGSLGGASVTTGAVAMSVANGTANADVITKTGISAILSGTQGLAGDCYLQAASLADSVIRTIAEVAVDANNFARISRLNNTIVGRVTVGGVEQAAITYTIPAPLRDKRCKVYLDFQLNNVNLYVNGLLVGTDTLADALTGLAGTYTGQSIDSANFWDGLIKSNVQMASLDATERDQWFQYASYSEMASELLYTID